MGILILALEFRIEATVFRLIYHIPINIILLAINLIFILLGWLVIPLAVLFHAYHESTKDDKIIYHFSLSAMFPWDNFEDGIAAGRQYKDCGAVWKQIIYWSCLRNPANGLRWVPILSCRINPARVRFIGSSSNGADYDLKPTRPEWFYCWHGLYSNIWIQFMWRGHLMRFWLGSKIFPSDREGVTAYRKSGAGFAIQLKRID
jgi:hypothetical protein